MIKRNLCAFVCALQKDLRAQLGSGPPCAYMRACLALKRCDGRRTQSVRHFCPTLDKLAGCLYNWLFYPDLCGDWELLQFVALCQEQSMWSLFWCCVLGRARARAFPVSPPHPREAGAGTLALLLFTEGLARSFLVSFPLLSLPLFCTPPKTSASLFLFRTKHLIGVANMR